MNVTRLLIRSALLLAVCLCVGCASYVTPGPAADMRLFGVATPDERDKQTDWRIKEKLDRKPLAQFPTGLAVARVQGAGYRSHTRTGYGDGAYSVVTTRDVETDDHFDRLAKLPLVHGVAPINRLLLPATLHNDEELRQAAAMLHADMLLLYTLDTEVYVGDSTSPVTW